MTANKPVGSVTPDTRGRISLAKFLPAATAGAVHLVYIDPTTGVVTLRPIGEHGEEAA